MTSGSDATQDKAAIYIDGSNFYHSLQTYCGRVDLDFARFANKLVANRRLLRVYYYNAPIDQSQQPKEYRRQQGFFNWIRRAPYFELRLGRLVYRGWPNVPPYEKGVDVKLATDLLTHAFSDNFHVAILVSQDTDFADALQAVKNHGLHVEVALFGGPWTSQELREVADKTIELNQDFLDDCWR